MSHVEVKGQSLDHDHEIIIAKFKSVNYSLLKVKTTVNTAAMICLIKKTQL